MSIGGLFTGRKAWSERDDDHSPLSSAEVVNKYQPEILSHLLLHRCVVELPYHLLYRRSKGTEVELNQKTILRSSMQI
jgi:hypothetical protein